MLVMLLMNLCAMAWHQPAGQAVPPNDDPGVYRAIIAKTIQPELDRFSAGDGIRTPAPVLTFDRTLMICRPAADHPGRWAASVMKTFSRSRRSCRARSMPASTDC
jgi:hypothetical protein